MNIVLCSMQLVTPLLTLVAMMVAVGQESKLSMITKDYKIGSFFEFLQLRKRIWKFQFDVMLVVACLGFPTTLL